ncbi:SAF domain-containing protein [uncultured Cellulomonas sp.]|uniref:SAF domain-containing protein n=1 Tax=uncultured Cellulomonas sp. TaxID=189682 RepID=UPI0026250BBA|nr:SAF domain-containing protein [uncultured Cellulomonas sp.]
MTTTTTTTTPQQAPARVTPAAPIRPKPLRPRRRWGMVGLGVALIALGSLAAVLVVGRLSNSVDAVALTREVPRGTVITAQDLTIVDLPSTASALQPVPAAQIDEVIGQYAATDLFPGALLTPQATTTALTPPSGQSVVGVALTAAQRPTIDLRAGDRVRIVETPITQGDPPAQTPPTLPATVVAVSPTDADTVIVNVAVGTQDAADLAARAATGRVALILDSLED